MGYSPWNQRVGHGLATEQQQQGFLVNRTMPYKRDNLPPQAPAHTHLLLPLENEILSLFLLPLWLKPHRDSATFGCVVPSYGMWEASKGLDLEAEPSPAPRHVPLQTWRGEAIDRELGSCLPLFQLKHKDPGSGTSSQDWRPASNFPALVEQAPGFLSGICGCTGLIQLKAG